MVLVILECNREICCSSDASRTFCTFSEIIPPRPDVYR